MYVWVVHVSTCLFVCSHVYQSEWIWLHVWVLIHICVCECMRVCACVCVWYPPLSLLTLVFETRSLPQPWAYWLGRLARELQNSSCLKFSQVLGYTHSLTTTSSYIGVGIQTQIVILVQMWASPPTVEESSALVEFVLSTHLSKQIYSSLNIEYIYWMVSLRKMVQWEDSVSCILPDDSLFSWVQFLFEREWWS